MDSARPQRAFHALGRIGGVLQQAVQWVVHELEILGENAITGLHTTFRVRLRHQSSGDSRDADLVVTDIEALNEGGTSVERLGQLTGLRSSVTNTTTGYIDSSVGIDIRFHNENQSEAINTAYGIRVDDIEQATHAYALHTGRGITHLGDVLELAEQDPTTSPTSGNIWIYPLDLLS